MEQWIALMQRKLKISSDLRRLLSAELWRLARNLWLHMHARGPNLRQHWVKWTLTSLCILQQTFGASRWMHGWIEPNSSSSVYSFFNLSSQNFVCLLSNTYAVRGMSLRKVTSLGSNFALVADQSRAHRFAQSFYQSLVSEWQYDKEQNSMFRTESCAKQQV